MNRNLSRLFLHLYNSFPSSSKVYLDFSTISQSDPSNPSSNIVCCSKKAFSFDEIARCCFTNSCLPSTPDAIFMNNGIYLFEFKKGYNRTPGLLKKDDHKYKEITASLKLKATSGLLILYNMFLFPNGIARSLPDTSTKKHYVIVVDRTSTFFSTAISQSYAINGGQRGVSSFQNPLKNLEEPNSFGTQIYFSSVVFWPAPYFEQYLRRLI